MFKYRPEQRQKMTQHILSQQFGADTLTPAPKNQQGRLMCVEGRETSVLSALFT